MKKTIAVALLIAGVLAVAAWGQQGAGLIIGQSTAPETTATVPRFYMLNSSHAPIAACDYDWKNCKLVGDGTLDDVVAVLYRQVKLADERSAAKDAENADLRKKYIHEMKAHLATLRRFQEFVDKVGKLGEIIRKPAGVQP